LDHLGKQGTGGDANRNSRLIQRKSSGIGRADGTAGWRRSGAVLDCRQRECEKRRRDHN
jgi:hypothetical protein